MWQRSFIVLLFLVFVVPLAQAATTPTADFTDNGDGTVTHKTTGLTWKRCAEGMTWTGSTCSGTAQTYSWSQLNDLSAGGWRLPRIDELVTIVESENFAPAINTSIFPNTPQSSFWSASTYAGDSTNAWFVNFKDGSNGTWLTRIPKYSVRLVRGGQSIDSSGLYTPTSDFSDNGDGSITHKKTGLTWKRCAEGQTWTGSTCSEAAKKHGWSAASALSSSSWRLPTQNELLTIVEWGKHSPSINAAMFPGTSTSYFWSATTYAGKSGPLIGGVPEKGWLVDFDTARDGFFDKVNEYCVRLVRVEQSSTMPSDAERVFNWAESVYAQHFAPAKPSIQETQGYTYRYYSGSGNYLAVKDGNMWLLGPLSGNHILDAGSLDGWLAKAKAAGF